MDFQRAELDEAISRMKRLAEAWRRALVEDATTGGLRKATTNTPVSLPPQLRSAAAEEEGGRQSASWAAGIPRLLSNHEKWRHQVLLTRIDRIALIRSEPSQRSLGGFGASSDDGG